jgi:hypothetical protein
MFVVRYRLAGRVPREVHDRLELLFLKVCDWPKTKVSVHNVALQWMGGDSGFS